MIASIFPPGWCGAQGEDLLDLIRGVTYEKSDTRSQPAPGLVAILRANNIAGGRIVADDLIYVPEKYVSDVQHLRPGDTLIASSSGSRTVVGKAALADEQHRSFAFGAFCIVARPRSPEISKWFSEFTKSNEYRAYVERVALGININNLRSSDLKALPIPVAPRAEKKSIVSKIGSLSAKSKRSRDHLDRVPQLIEKYKQGILAAAFRGELTDCWRTRYNFENEPGNIRELLQDVRDKIRSNQRLRSKGKNRSLPGRANLLPSLPRTWAWCTFDDCSWDLTVGHVGSMKDRYVNAGVPFLRSLNIRPNQIRVEKIVYIDEEFHQELRKSNLAPGDVVVVRTGDPGVAAVIPENLPVSNCSDLVIVRLIESISPHYAAYYMNSDFAKSIVRGVQVGVAQQHFNVGAMSEMPIPVTTLHEQNKIVKSIDAAFSWIDRLAVEATSARKLIDHLDQAVLSKAFRGELVPQDPDDEPASVLLERIKAERAGATPARRGRGRPRLATTT